METETTPQAVTAAPGEELWRPDHSDPLERNPHPACAGGARSDPRGDDSYRYLVMTLESSSQEELEPHLHVQVHT